MLIFTSEGPSIQGLVQKAIADVLAEEAARANVVSFADARARLRPAPPPEPNIVDRLTDTLSSIDAVRYRDSHEEFDGHPPDCA